MGVLDGGLIDGGGVDGHPSAVLSLMLEVSVMTKAKTSKPRRDVESRAKCSAER
jgi:hypothetical protein